MRAHNPPKEAFDGIRGTARKLAIFAVQALVAAGSQ